MLAMNAKKITVQPAPTSRDGVRCVRLQLAALAAPALATSVLLGCQGESSTTGRSALRPSPEAQPAAVATAPSSGNDTASAQKGYSDPFAYCAAVGTADVVDARYTGPREPAVIRNKLQMPGNFAWRCAHGRVMACSYGANLNCGKANTSRTPNPGEVRYCRENPNDINIPAYITGHDTIFGWSCKNGKAVASGSGAGVDDRGFMEHLWYAIAP